MQLQSDIENQLAKRLDAAPLLTLRLDLINKCNLRCVMCHYSDPEIALRPAQSISVEQFDTWFRSIGPNVRDIMLSCGDEPLMSPHFVGILEKLSSYSDSLDVGLCTNGMLMNAKIRHAMIEHGLTYALFSLDGATKETMERIRVKSSYDKVLGNIKALKALKEATGSVYPKFIVDFVMMRSNIHETIAFVDLCKALGAELIDFRHAVSSAYWDDQNEKLENFPGEYNHFRQRILDRAASVGIDVTLPEAFECSETRIHAADYPDVNLSDYNRVRADRNLDKFPSPKRFSSDFVSRSPLKLGEEFFGESYCERPFSEIMLRNQREVLPCPWHGKVLGELNSETNLRDIFLGKNFADLRATMLSGKIDPGCQNCPVKRGFLPTDVAGNQ